MALAFFALISIVYAQNIYIEEFIQMEIDHTITFGVQFANFQILENFEATYGFKLTDCFQKQINIQSEFDTQNTIISASKTPLFHWVCNNLGLRGLHLYDKSGNGLIDIANGSLQILQSFLHGSRTPSISLVRCFNSLNVEIGDSQNAGEIDVSIQDSILKQKSSSLLLIDCENIRIHKASFVSLSSNANSQFQINNYCPCLNIYATTSTHILVQNCIFQNCTYSGRDLMSGAVYIQFSGDQQVNSNTSIVIKQSTFIQNRGVGAGAIAFRNKAVQTVKIENCDFNDNSYQQVKWYGSSGIFVFNNLGNVLSSSSFRTCFRPSQSVDNIYNNNQQPFYAVLCSDDTLHYLNPHNPMKYYVSQQGIDSQYQDGSQINPFASINYAVNRLSGIVQSITLLDQFCSLNDKVIHSNGGNLTIQSDLYFNAELFNNVFNQQYAFEIENGQVIIKHFKITQGYQSILSKETSVLFLIKGGYLQLYNCTLTSNGGEGKYIYGSFIEGRIGIGLIIDNCIFMNTYFSNKCHALMLESPQVVQIIQSKFINLQIYSSGDDSGTVLIHIGQNTQNIIITQCTFNKCICGSDQMNKTSGALFLYIISKDWNGIIDLSNSSFIDNKGTESGGIFIKHNQEYSRIYQRLKLDNQYFFGNNIDGRSPTAHIDINSNIDLSSLFNSKGSIYGKEIEVDKDSAVDDDEPFTLIKGQTYSNSLHFHSINAAMKFTNRFIGWQNQLTITSGNHIESVNLISEQNHSFKGRKYLEDSEQANLYSFGIQPIFSLSTGILNLKWLTLTKSQLNDTPILIRIENGNLQLFECQFIGVKSKQDKSSFIQIGDKIADVNNVDILRCSFSEGQFGKDSGAVSIIGFGRMWIEGSQFIGNETVQMGSFIKVINNNDTNIVNCIFKDSSFSQSTDSAISIQDINNHLSIILCTFTNLRSNNIQTPAISCIQRINSSIITLQFNSFIRCGGGRVDSGAISVICDEFIHFTSLHINSCIFHKNTGMLSGAVYIDSFNYLNSYIQFKGNLLRQNIANSLIANDIYVKNENNMIFENNIGNRSSGNIIIGNGDKSQEIYGYQQLYKSREQVHVRKEGLNADEQDILIYGVGLGIFEHPLRTLDYAVNCRDISQKLDIILYRQRYDVQNTLYILDDRISIHDTDICGSLYHNQDSIQSNIFSKNNLPYLFLVISGLLELGGIQITWNSEYQQKGNIQCNGGFVYIGDEGSFEANSLTINLYGNIPQLIQATNNPKVIKINNNYINNYCVWNNNSITANIINIYITAWSSVDISQTTFYQLILQQKIRAIYITIQRNYSPQIRIDKCNFYNFEQENTSIAMIIGSNINPSLTFIQCNHNQQSFNQQLLLSGQRLQQQYDGLLTSISDYQNIIGDINQINQHLYTVNIVTNSKVGFVGSQYVEQQNPYSYIAAGQGGHIQMWGITFIQLSNGESIIKSLSPDSIISLNNIKFQHLSVENEYSEVKELQYIQMRNEINDLNSRYNYLQNSNNILQELQRIRNTRSIQQPFITIENGYSIELNDIIFNQGIITSTDTPLIKSIGQLKEAIFNSINITKIGRRYGGPFILSINMRDDGLVQLNNISINGSGLIFEKERQFSYNPYISQQELNLQYQYLCDNNESEYLKSFEQQDSDIDDELHIEYPYYCQWSHSAIEINGGRLNISESIFIGLGIDGALRLQNVDANIENTTIFRRNNIYLAALDNKKEYIPDQYINSKDNNANTQIDETDQRIYLLRRYRSYTKNIQIYGNSILRAYNSSFKSKNNGKQLTNKNNDYEDYQLNIQYESSVAFDGDILQAIFPFVPISLTLVSTKYTNTPIIYRSDGRNERQVQIEIKGNGFIPCVELFLELRNIKENNQSQILYHYSLLHNNVWNQNKTKPIMYSSVNSNINNMNQNKGQPNSYVSEVLGGGIHVQWISENAFIIKIMHIQQIAKEDEEIIGQNQDSDDFIKDWEMRIGVEYHRLLDGQRRLYDCATPFVPMNWILKKQVYGWLIAIVVILSVLFSSSVVFTIIAVVYRTKKSRKDMRDEEAQSQVSDWH